MVKYWNLDLLEIIIFQFFKIRSMLLKYNSIFVSTPYWTPFRRKFSTFIVEISINSIHGHSNIIHCNLISQALLTSCSSIGLFHSY